MLLDEQIYSLLTIFPLMKSNSTGSLSQTALFSPHKNTLNRFVCGQYFQLQELLNAQKSAEDMKAMKELYLTGNKSRQMPNVENTLTIYFRHLLILDVSNNLISRVEAPALCRACPLLERLYLTDNMIPDLSEIMPLGKMRHLNQLDFRGNPCADTEKKLDEAREQIIGLQKISFNRFEH